LRDHDEIQIGIPRARQVVGCMLFSMGMLVAVGWLPLTAVVVGVALLLVGAGFLV
jgi:hypothetical protein